MMNGKECWTHAGHTAHAPTANAVTDCAGYIPTADIVCERSGLFHALRSFLDLATHDLRYGYSIYYVPEMQEKR